MKNITLNVNPPHLGSLSHINCACSMENRPFNLNIKKRLISATILLVSVSEVFKSMDRKLETRGIIVLIYRTRRNYVYTKINETIFFPLKVNNLVKMEFWRGKMTAECC